MQTAFDTLQVNSLVVGYACQFKNITEPLQVERAAQKRALWRHILVHTLLSGGGARENMRVFDPRVAKK